MTVYSVLRKLLTIGLVLSLATFALSYVVGLLDNRSLSSFVALLATLVLALTPLASVIFIAVEETRRRDYGGLIVAALVMLVIIISLILMPRGLAP